MGVRNEKTYRRSRDCRFVVRMRRVSAIGAVFCFSPRGNSGSAKELPRKPPRAELRRRRCSRAIIGAEKMDGNPTETQRMVDVKR